MKIKTLCSTVESLSLSVYMLYFVNMAKLRSSLGIYDCLGKSLGQSNIPNHSNIPKLFLTYENLKISVIYMYKNICITFENQPFPREILSYYTGHWVYSWTWTSLLDVSNRFSGLLLPVLNFKTVKINIFYRDTKC